jgi:two-component system sensor histidine kinase/response regulator
MVPTNPVLLASYDYHLVALSILGDTVARWGMKPRLEASGDAGLHALRKASHPGEPFRLVLSDMQMPEMDGFSFMGRIGDDPKFAGLAIIMLTPGRRRGDAVRGQELGLASHLSKPLARSELLLAIRQALGQVQVDPKSTLITPSSRRKLGTGVRILLAEDNKVNQRVAVRMLEKSGHRVIVTGNGREVLAAPEQQDFDLVLMDVQMPEMGGLEATTRIRDRERSTGGRMPIVAMTAGAMQGDEEKCLQAGMDAYISKPVRAEELLAMVEAHAAIRVKLISPAPLVPK